MLKINTLQGHERMSTQDLLLKIEDAVASGETDFEIEASGQHDIGGPLWHPEGKKLSFLVRNAGQRVGAMCLENTEIVVEESASADVGWLNAGGRIVVKGDAGDTAGHCAAGGTIYIGGRAGTRSGSLMKHDPLYEPPELWVLKNVGSFSFEFMGGGIAVVCGYDSEEFASVLGDRSGIGMVGGTVYVRGNASGIAKDLHISELEDKDIAYLSGKMDDFLSAVEHTELKDELTKWDEWKKIEPLSFDEKTHKKEPMDMKTFRMTEWVKGGIFSDVCTDDFVVNPTVMTGIYRQRVPSWDNARLAAPCEFNCPASIPTQQRYNLLRAGKYEEAYKLVLKYTPFPGSVCGSVCPNPCMDGCSRGTIDQAIQIGPLGRCSIDVKLPRPEAKTGKKIAVLGGGVGGLSAAWQLALAGHEVTVYEADEKMGGKLEQVIPRARLPHEILEKELQRISDIGVKFVNNYQVDAEKFQELKADNDAVIVATGGHKARVFPWPGNERIVKGLDFLKAINKGQKPEVGKRVVVIGCGNAGIDVAMGAYQMGAEAVTCIDVQKPAAFDKEIVQFKRLGGEIIWPVMTQEITPEGIVAADGRVIPADTVIIAVGESPVLDYLPEGINKFRDWVLPNEDTSIMEGVFAAGDVIKPGLLIHAIAAGKKAAAAADAYVLNKPYKPEADKALIEQERLSKAYFGKCHACDLPEAKDDFKRCISCGTCRDCQMCYNSCPEKAITRQVLSDGSVKYLSNPNKCIGCGICAGVCPCGVWTLKPNEEVIPMYKTYNK